ncbi:MAG: HDIG domain-containing protein [Sphaerochaetaceae bacterium]|nr:HDIG domain-containing protein [Sphaerochaetaceae bacterium]
MDNRESIFNKLKAKDDEVNIKTKIIFSLLLLATVVIMIIMPYFVSGNLVGSSISSKTLQIKQLAPEDLFVKRSFEYVDEKATQEKKDLALTKVFPIFTFDVSKTYLITDRILNFTQNIDNENQENLLKLLVSLNQSEKDIFLAEFNNLTEQDRKLLSSWVLDISKNIITSGYFEKNEVNQLRNENINKISLNGYLNDFYNVEKIETTKTLTLNSLITSDNLDEKVSLYLEESYPTNQNIPQLVFLSIKGLIEPNVTYDSLLTEVAKDKAENSISDVIVYVPAGQKILSQDAVISEKDLELLKQVEQHSAIFSNTQIFARILLIILITVFSFYWFWTRSDYTFRRVQFTYIYLILMLFTILFSFLITYYGSKYNITVIGPTLPVLFGTFFLKNTTGKKRFGFLFTIQYSLFATLFPGTTFFTFFYLAAIGISFLYIIIYDQNRLSRITSIFEGGLIALLMTIILYAIQGYPFNSLFVSMIILILNILTCFLLERVLLPFIDNYLNIPTIFRLEELSSMDHKLLTKLKINAQGTYNHSINVSELAFEAAKAIGVNAQLCRVAALYHDVGKLDHPEYFTENQEDGVNKHDELTPSMSGSIIRSHVKLGVDACKSAGLPQEIIDIVSEHHGNDLIQYFYHEAIKDSNDNPYNRVVPSDYCYTGNPPRSKESAIVMIADSVEAASHSNKTSAQKVGRLISTIIKQKLDRGQLNDSHLDLSELKIIEQSLEHSLVGKLHTRIKYPNEEDKPNN